jgi:hypothetical protein
MLTYTWDRNFESENQALTKSKVALAWTGTLKMINLRSRLLLKVKVSRLSYIESETASAARSLLKVRCLMSLERRAGMEVMLDIRPNKPKQEKKIPSHQSSYSFQTWKKMK